MPTEFTPILDYAWDDADTPSSEYTGLPMWTTDAPFKLDFNFWDRTVPLPEVPVAAHALRHDRIFREACRFSGSGFR
jgi:hypothetical protein